MYGQSLCKKRLPTSDLKKDLVNGEHLNIYHLQTREADYLDWKNMAI